MISHVTAKPCDFQWAEMPLKRVLRYSTGGTPPTSAGGYYGGEFPWLTIGDLKEKVVTGGAVGITRAAIRRARIPVSPAGSLLYSFKLSIGQVAIAGRDLYTNEAIASFYPTKGLQTAYWYFALPIFLERNAATNIYDAKLLNQFLIRNAKLLVPSLDEQAHIAEVLDTKDKEIISLVRKKRGLIDLLKEAKAIVIAQAVTRGLDSGVSMKDSGAIWMGEVPEHWDVRKAKYLFRLIVEPAPKNNDMELLSIYTDIGVRPRRELAERGNKASTTDGYFKVKKGDFIVNKLLAWMGALGLSNYDGVTSPAYDILRKTTTLEERFYDYVFRCGILFPEFKRRSRGIMDMRLRLYFDEFGQIPLMFPPLEEQVAIVEYLDDKIGQTDIAIAKIEREIELVQEYRTVLISDAVTGKLKIPEAREAEAA